VPILPMLFGPFRPQKSRVHLFNNLFAASLKIGVSHDAY
jgi:hypothetical protein